jgi:hypothetical protein
MAAALPLICDAAAQAASTKTHDAMAVLKAPRRAIVREKALKNFLSSCFYAN